MAVSILERLLERVKVNANGCFEWQLHRCPFGYGRTGLGGNGQIRLAHRVMYEAVRGSAEGRLVCHKCDNPRCINPAHLFLGTHLDNARDAAEKDRTTYGRRAPAAKLDDKAVVEIVELYNGGMTHGQIASRFGVSRSVVSEVLEGKTWRRVAKGPVRKRRTPITKRKITPDDAAEIRRLCDAGVRQVDIAQQFGITQVTVSAIKTRRLWPSVV